MGKTYYIPVETLGRFTKDVLLRAGLPSEDADICTDVLLASDLRGIESHGIGRLKFYYNNIKTGQHQARAHFEVMRESPTTAVVDGHHSMGMVTAKRAMQLAIEKAAKYGMGAVAVRNSTHFGIAGYYPLLATRAGMIGLTVTNTRPAVAPTFGVQPLLGTNPIAFGAPSDEPFPFLFDAATPIIQRGKVEVYARAEKPILSGWIIDEQGNDLTDPGQILADLPKDKAALLPLGGKGEELGGHKGYGLGTLVEILSASLQQGAFLHSLSGIGAEGQPVPFRIGHFFMAINVESFCPLEDFKRTTGQILRDLRNSKKAPGQPRIYTAGEKEYENEKRVRAEGIPVVPNLQKDLKYLQTELGLSEYDFPF